MCLFLAEGEMGDREDGGEWKGEMAEDDGERAIHSVDLIARYD